MRIDHFASAALVAGSLVSSPAFASLSGDTIDAAYYYGADTSVGNLFQDLPHQTASASFVFDGLSPTLTAAVSGTQIIFTLAGIQEFDSTDLFNGAVFTDLTNSNITGVSLDGATTTTGTSPGLSYSANSITVNLAGTYFSAGGSQVVIDISSSSPTDSPEPISLSVLLTGLVGLGVSRLRKRQ